MSTPIITTFVLNIFFACYSFFRYWTGPLEGVKSPTKLMRWGQGVGAVCAFVKQTVNTLKCCYFYDTANIKRYTKRINL